MTYMEANCNGCDKVPEGWECQLQKGHAGYCLVRELPMTVDQAARAVLLAYQSGDSMKRAMADLEMALL